jgi:queuosine precursor transporter
VTTTPTPPAAPPKVAFARTGLGIYPILVTVFCCLLLLSNIAAVKGIAFGPILTDGGFVLFPLTYVIGDVLSEVYGLKATRKAILLGFCMALLASLTFWLVGLAPGTADFDGQAAFDRILGVVPRILLASVCGYLIGEFLNTFVLVKIKERTRERHLWARLVGSTIVGEFGDTLTFCLIAAPAIGIIGFHDVAVYTGLGFVYKVGLEIVLMPITYRVIAAIKKREPTYLEAMKLVEQRAATPTV